MNFTFYLRYRTQATKDKTAYSYLWIEDVKDLDEAWTRARESISQMDGAELGFVLKGLQDGLRAHKSACWRNNHNERKRIKTEMESKPDFSYLGDYLILEKETATKLYHLPKKSPFRQLIDGQALVERKQGKFIDLLCWNGDAWIYIGTRFDKLKS